MLWQYCYRSHLTAAVTGPYQGCGMPAVTNHGGGMLFFGVYFQQHHTLQSFLDFCLLCMGVCAPIALDKAT